MSKKRAPTTVLNHDNWDEEVESEEPGVFTPADSETIKGRVIKKAKRRGLQNADGAPSIFAGFGGFSKPADSAPSAAASFDFLKSAAASNGSESKPSSGGLFNFSTPAATSSSGFTFGSGSPAVAKKSEASSDFTFGNGASAKTSNSANNSAIFAFGSGKSDDSQVSSKPAEAKKDVFAPITNPITMPKTNKWNCPGCFVQNEADKDKCPCCQEPKPGGVVKKPEAPALAPITNPIVLPKSDKWSCPTCMVANNADKEVCACCQEPKPGSKANSDTKTKETTLGSVTSSGFKFGASPASNSSSGFSFGSTNNKSPAKSSNDTDKEEFSKEYLAHLKALNVQVSTWIKNHVDKNPYVFLSPIFKDYEAHLKDIEAKHKTNKKNADPEPSKRPLLAGVFGNSTDSETGKKSSAEPIKFGTGSSGFAFGSSTTSGSSNDTNKSGMTFGKKAEAESSPKPSGFTFGASEPSKTASSGFSFGTASNAKEDKPASSGFTFGAKSDDDSGKSTGFSFGSSTKDSGSSATFSFGSKSDSEKKESGSTGFSFGSSSSDKPASTGFTFGASTNTNGSSIFGAGATAGFSFGAPIPNPATAAPTETKNEEDEEDEPPKVEVNQVVEEDAFHTVRCKLFYKKEKEFKDKGVGMLHLKKVENDKTQMVVRAETNLGNILLNILVGDKMNVIKRKNNIQFVCVPNPPIKGMEDGPVIMLVKVKDALMADQLEEKLKEATK